MPAVVHAALILMRHIDQVMHIYPKTQSEIQKGQFRPVGMVNIHGLVYVHQDINVLS